MANRPESSSDWNISQAGVLAVGSGSTEFVRQCLELKDENSAADLLIVSPGPEAVGHVRQRRFAVVLLEDSPSTAGNLELILEGFAKDRGPGFVVFSDRARSSNLSKPSRIRLVQPVAKPQLSSLLASCIKEYEAGLSPDAVSLTDFLNAVAGCPDEAWLRVTNQQGKTGDLCIRQGGLIYAEVGGLNGDQALAHMLSWSSCTFEYRELPAFLNRNLQRTVAEVISNGVQKSNWQGASQSANPSTPDLEEPSEFPSFDAADIASSTAAANAGLDSIAEPDELPAFLFRAPDEEILVEEPSDLPAFIGAEDQLRVAPEKLQATHARRATPSLPPAFASIAIWGASGLEYCDPPDAQAQFHKDDLKKLWEEAKRCGQRHGGGLTHLICLHTDAGSLAVAVIPGGGTMVAIGLKGFGFGPEEATQLRQFLEAITVTDAAFAG
jgi:hypothetical protein